MSTRDDDTSSSEELDYSPDGSDAKRQGGGADRSSFESQVLAMLGSLQSDMQSMRKRVSELEDRQTQSLPYVSPKGKEGTRGSRARAGLAPATMQSITPASAAAQGATYASVTAQSATPASVTAQSATPASVKVQSAAPASITKAPPASATVQSATPASATVQSTTPATGVAQNDSLWSVDAQSQDPNSHPPSTSTLWEDALDEGMDYDAVPVWDDDEEDDATDHKGVKLFKVSEKTEKFLTHAFTSASPNTTRRQWRDKFGAPHTNATACPNLDKIIKARLSPAAKSRDRQLAKQQALSLDAVGPISFILEEAAKGQLNQKSAIEAAQTALKLLGNASMHASRERRKNALQSMNPRLADMAEDDAVYRTAAPSLFGDGFCKRAKERDEELRCLNMAVGRTSGPTRDSHFFRGGRSYKQQSRGSGQYSFKGQRGSSHRQHPYRQFGNQWHRKQQDPKKN